MATAREYTSYRAPESATMMREWLGLWPPLAALRAMEIWTQAGGRRNLPKQVIQLHERLEFVEDRENAIEASVQPIGSEGARLQKRIASVEKQVSAGRESIEPLGAKVEDLREKNSTLERRVSDLDSAMGSSATS
jgi:chromosome segregation ATPase